MLKKFLIAVLVLGSITSCIKDSEDDQCSYDPCAFKAPTNEVQDVKAYLTANNITATEHCSGLFYNISNPGTGKAPTICSYITASYRGSLTNGSVFEQGSLSQPYQLGSLVRGWVNGLPFIKEGGIITLFIPPSLGYGSQGSATIPPNSILIFDVTLNTVQ